MPTVPHKSNNLRNQVSSASKSYFQVHEGMSWLMHGVQMNVRYVADEGGERRISDTSKLETLAEGDNPKKITGMLGYLKVATPSPR